jgi:hypothetical protein
MDEFCNWLESPEAEDFFEKPAIITSRPRYLMPV